MFVRFFLSEARTWEGAKVLLAKDSCTALEQQILFYLTIKIKVPGWVHCSSFSHSPFPYLDHVEFPEKSSKLSSGATLSSPSWIPLTLRKRDKRGGMLSFTYVSFLKNTYITFFFLRRMWAWGGAACVCVHIKITFRDFLRSNNFPDEVNRTAALCEKLNMWLTFCWWTNTAEVPWQICRGGSFNLGGFSWSIYDAYLTFKRRQEPVTLIGLRAGCCFDVLTSQKEIKSTGGCRKWCCGQFRACCQLCESRGVSQCAVCIHYWMWDPHLSA